MATKKGYKRGYAVALLLGLEEDCAYLWRVYSHVIKPEKTINLSGHRDDAKAIYYFHECIVNTLRPSLKEGTRSILIVSAPRSNYAQLFLTHVQSHHVWLTQGPGKAVLSQLTGSATTTSQIASLSRNPRFREVIGEMTSEESEKLMDLLEKRLSAEGPEPLVLYSLEDVEHAVFGEWKPDKPKPQYLLLTNNYLSEAPSKSRVHRLIQIAQNRHVQTRTLVAGSPAGKRLTQLGGIVCILQ